VSHVITVLTRNEFSNKKYFLDNNIKYFSCLFQSDFTRDILDKISYSELPRLYDIVNLKKNKLMVSLDISDPELFLLALDTISENLVMLKTHIDIMDFSNYDKNEFIDKLSIKKFENNFEILEDYKFRDIAEISYRQLISQGIDKYADYITCHGITGDGFIRKLRDVDSKIKIILISQMSSKNNLITEEYHNEIVRMARNNKDIVKGLIVNNVVYNDLLCFKPGIRLDDNNDGSDQTYSNVDGKYDFFIVGRGIYKQGNIKENFNKYSQKMNI